MIQASEDTKMEGSAKASIYSYVTNTLRIEPLYSPVCSNDE
jgi:hypothetical protein